MSGIAALVDHLFRREAGKMVATLVRILGVRNVDVAEDVVQDALLRALEVWTYHGIPDNPSAWLFQTARHRAATGPGRHSADRQPNGGGPPSGRGH